MKLKSLHVKNVASIAEATIDFSAAPLRDAPVFLICGDTGSGKSTLLDAICLCLYGDVPRLANTGMKDKPESQNAIRANDAMQLLRQGTVEGFAELGFTANDGKDYVATWRVRRAYKRVNGTLKEERTLMSSDSSIKLDKKTDIDRLIPNLTGLEFAQFCRTTMLAQGEFTRFLKSAPKEKADILEKITGCNRYSRISTKIFEIATAKARIAENLLMQMQNVHILSDEALSSIKKEIEELTTQSTGLAKELTGLRKRQKDLETLAGLTTELETASAEYQRAQAELQSEAVVATTAIVRDFDESENERYQLQNSIKASESLAKHKGERSNLRSDYSAIVATLELLNTEIKKTEVSLNEKTLQLDAEGDKAKAFELADEIDRRLENICTIATEIESDNKNIALKELEIASKTKELKAQQEIVDSTKAELEKAEKQEQELTTQVNQAQIDKLIQEKDSLSEQLTAIVNFIKTITDSSEANAKAEAANKALADNISESATCNEVLPDLQRSRDKAKKRLDWARNFVEKNTILLRSRLEAGCTCPVCRQKVKEVALINTSDDEEQIQLLADCFDKAEEALNTKRTHLAELSARRKALETNLDEATKEKSRLDNLFTEQLAALPEGCTPDNAATKFGEIKVSIDAKTDAISKASELSAQLRTATNKLKVKQKAYDEAQKKENQASTYIHGQEQVLSTLKAEKLSREGKLSNLISQCAEYQGFSPEVELSGTTATGIRKAFALEVSTHNQLVKDLEALEKLKKEFTDTYEAITAKIHLCRNLWNEISEPTESKSTILFKDLTAAAENLYNEVYTKTTLIQIDSDELKDAEDALSAANVGPERRQRLLELVKRTDIDELRGKLIAAHTALSVASNKVKATELRIKEHKETCAEPYEGEEEQLSTLIPEKETMQSSIAQQIGSKQQQLNDDAARRKETGTLKEKLDAATKDSNRWQKLKDLLGSSDGDKFRKIALAKVLQILLVKANLYLHKLSDRYTLLGTPGLFNIDVEDAMADGLRRSANTNSGGESFLVSLSLALALSDLREDQGSDIIFIDEGFGTLSDKPLEDVTTLLESLHSTIGRRVGIISHVEELRNRIPTQIKVATDPRIGASTVAVQSKV